MDQTTLMLGLVVLLFAILGLGVWVAVALATLGFVAIVASLTLPPGAILATAMWQQLNSWDLTALPMFILMGDILFRTRALVGHVRKWSLAAWSGAYLKRPGKVLKVSAVLGPGGGSSTYNRFGWRLHRLFRRRCSGSSGGRPASTYRAASRSASLKARGYWDGVGDTARWRAFRQDRAS